MPVYLKAAYPRQLDDAKDHEMIKRVSFDVPPDTNALCQRMANEVHRDVLPGDSHVTAMESLKDESV